VGFVDWLLSFDLGAGVMPHTANAYPYYTFTQGFLHAHTVITPFQLLHITLVFGLLTAWAGGGVTRRDILLGAFVLALALGFTAFTNAWTYLASLLVTLLALLLLKLRVSRWWLLAIVVLSFLMYLPYYLTTGTGGISGIGLVSERAHLVHFLEMFALFLFAFVSMLVAMRAGGMLRDRVLVGILALTVAAGSVAFVLGFQFLLVLLPLILVSLYGICRMRDDPVEGLMLVLVLVGALILAGCEIFFVDDAFSAPNERYNTILKLHLSVWVMWGVAASYAVFRVMRGLRGRSKAVWLSLLGVLIVASLLQPIGLTLGWTSGRHETHGMNRGTLDGLAYVEELAPGDFWAIPWIRANIEGSPVILEAPGETYRYSSRISTLTGLPTVIGWASHEVMWRGSWDAVSGRDTDVDTIYETADNDRAISLLVKYNVRYVYIGEVERGRYAPEGLRKFAEHPDSYSLAYHNEWAELYEVIAR
jgi:YYY domain-containing protein